MDLNQESVHLGRSALGLWALKDQKPQQGGLSSNFPCRYFDKTAYFNQILWEIGETERESSGYIMFMSKA